MRILHTVESYLPARHGMSEVVRQLSERLVLMGHEVTVATSADAQRTASTINAVKIVEFDCSGNVVRGLEGDVAAYRNFLLTSRFDIMTNFAAQQWATDIALPLLPEISAAKVFVPTGFSALYDDQYKSYYESMATWMRNYDMNVFLSETYRDREFARQCGIEKCILIPNGAAASEFLAPSEQTFRERLGITDDDFLVLHVGAFTGVKGHLDAIEIFSRSTVNNAALLLVSDDFDGLNCYGASKIPGMSEHIRNIGRFFFKYDHFRVSGNMRFLDIAKNRHMISNKLTKRRIILKALSRKDTVAAYKCADLFLFPSHIECSPIVLFECMASRTPFLTTDVGNAEEIIQWSQGGKLLPTEKEESGMGLSFAKIRESSQLLFTIVNDPDKRTQMAEAGFEAWQKRFTWEVIANQYQHLYKRLLSEK